ncbi:ACT domain-containing protein [Streptomyces sp. NPDC058373]|uniref:ACT domain-containing protein n=1 Tax=Streptomyces sp. NPDC058373 TaxID=3346465 RepID=UPI003660AEA1
MHPEHDLGRLLAGLSPERHPGAYVYATLPEDQPLPAGLDPVVTVREPEGRTLVVTREEAHAHGLTSTYPAGWITLRVHSALDAVGLTAAVSALLADAGMSCNVVAGFHHDHLFVPEARADEAVTLLRTAAAR